MCLSFIMPDELDLPKAEFGPSLIKGADKEFIAIDEELNNNRKKDKYGRDKRIAEALTDQIIWFIRYGIHFLISLLLAFFIVLWISGRQDRVISWIETIAVFIVGNFVSPYLQQVFKLTKENVRDK